MENKIKHSEGRCMEFGCENPDVCLHGNGERENCPSYIPPKDKTPQPVEKKEEWKNIPVPEFPGNWPEDYEHENGRYQNKCAECQNLFYGHKRRPLCKICAEKPIDWETMAKKQPPTKHEGWAWQGCWADGEMTGFARCMVKKVKPLEQAAINDSMAFSRELERLEKELAELRDELATWKDNAVYDNKQIEELKAERNALEYSHRDLVIERNKLKKELLDSYEQAGHWEIESKKLKADNERMKDEIREMQGAAYTINILKQGFNSELQRRWPSVEEIRRQSLGYNDNTFEIGIEWLKSYLNK